MTQDYIDNAKHAASRQYASWLGAERLDRPTQPPDAAIAAKLVQDARAGLAGGASNVILSGRYPASVELAKQMLTADELQRVMFVDM